MAGKIVSRSPGSIVLQILIVLLVAVLLLAIMVPRKQWVQQEERLQISHDRMENLNNASKFYLRQTRSFTSNPTELLEYAEAETISAFRAGFKMDRLTREDSGIDSFLVDYFDPYQSFSHYEEVASFHYPAGKDSVILSIVPLKRFSFLPKTQYAFAADGDINCRIDDRGDQGKFLLVGTQGIMRGYHLDEENLREAIKVKAADYIYNIDTKDLNKCPTTGEFYRLNVNVKIAIQAEMTGTLQPEPTDTSLGSSELFSSLVVYRWLKEADALAKAALIQDKIFEAIEDSLIQLRNKMFLDSVAAKLRTEGKDMLAEAVYDTLLDGYSFEDPADIGQWEVILESSYALMNNLKADAKLGKVRDNIVNMRKDFIAAQNLNNKLAEVEKDGGLVVSESGIVTTIADSIDFYSNPELIKHRLFRSRNDSVTISYLKKTEIAELMNRISYTESYRVGRVDSTGLTIKSPIDGLHVIKNRTLLERIFSVEGEENHGKIENGDRSWNEKR